MVLRKRGSNVTMVATMRRAQLALAVGAVVLLGLGLSFGTAVGRGSGLVAMAQGVVLGIATVCLLAALAVRARPARRDGREPGIDDVAGRFLGRRVF